MLTTPILRYILTFRIFQRIRVCTDMTIQEGMLWFLHADQALTQLYNNYGLWFYFILFLIIFSETALIIFPFLPGDSLLFAVGAFSATIDEFTVYLFLALLSSAAIMGNQCNFWIGKYVGHVLAASPHPVWRWLKLTERIDQSEQFYLRHGGKALILSRFMPILRSFVPFVAGIARMSEGGFLFFNVVGALLWVPGLISLGFVFGSVPWVQEHFTALIFVIIIVSLVPAGISFWKTR